MARAAFDEDYVFRVALGLIPDALRLIDSEDDARSYPYFLAALVRDELAEQGFDVAALSDEIWDACQAAIDEDYMYTFAAAGELNASESKMYATPLNLVHDTPKRAVSAQPRVRVRAPRAAPVRRSGSRRGASSRSSGGGSSGSDDGESEPALGRSFAPGVVA